MNPFNMTCKIIGLTAAMAFVLSGQAYALTQFPLDGNVSTALFRSIENSNIRPNSDTDMTKVFETSLICFATRDEEKSRGHGNGAPSPQNFSCTIVPENGGQQFQLDEKFSETIYRLTVASGIRPVSDSDMMTVYETSLICFNAKDEAATTGHGNGTPSPQNFISFVLNFFYFKFPKILQLKF